MAITIVDPSSTDLRHLASVDVKFSGIHIGGGVYFSANHYPSAGGTSKAIPQRSLAGEVEEHDTREIDFTLPDADDPWLDYRDDTNGNGLDTSDVVKAGFDISMHVGDPLSSGSFYDGAAVPLLIAADFTDITGSVFITGYPGSANALDGQEGTLHETSGTISGHTTQDVSGDQGGYFTVDDAQILGGMSGGGAFLDFDPDGDGTAQTYAIGTAARAGTIDYPDPIPDEYFAQVAAFSQQYQDLASAIAGLTGAEARTADDFARMTLLSGQTLGSGATTVDGTFFHEDIYGGVNADSLSGAGGNDSIAGGDANDTLDGGSGDDTLLGEDGNDSLLGGDGADSIEGGSGNDTILFGAGDDTVFGGIGNDLIDDIGGSSLVGANLLDGGAGLDTVWAGGGDDTVRGGDAADSLMGDAGHDSLMGEDGDDVLVGGDGADTLDGGTGNDTLTGGAGSDFFDDAGFGGGASDSITDFDDTLDVLDLAEFFVDLAEVQAAASNISGSEIEIKLDEGTGPRAAEGGFLRVSGVQVADLTASNVMVACFVSGTLIDTARGPVPVQDLKRGDLIWTRDAGAQPLRHVLSRRVAQTTTSAAPIVLEPGSLGPGCPARRLAVSPQHRVLVVSAIARRMTGGEALVPAVKLLALPGVRRGPLAPLRYHHLVLTRHHVIRAEGCLTESFYPGGQALASQPPLVARWLASQTERRPACPLLDGKEARRVVALHKRHRSALQSAEISTSVISGTTPKRTGRMEHPKPPETTRSRAPSRTWP